jgi:transcriptional regulator with XRE-family HTH domain
LGRFLRDRRARITRVSAGLITNRSGRSSTLTQEDLARLTGYSLRTISALEQGTAHRPTPELLDAITDALRLPSEDRRALWRLATGAAAPEVVDFTHRPNPALTKLINQMSPYPAYLCDSAWNVQAHNQEFAEWFFDAEAMPPEERNVALWLVSPHARRHVIVNWPEVLANMVDRLRGLQAHMPGDQRITDVIGKLRQRSEHFAYLWENSTTVADYPPALQLRARPPGHTDPRQNADEQYQLPLTIPVLTPITPGDDRRVVVFFTPDSYQHTPGVRSVAACAACARDRSASN